MRPKWTSERGRQELIDICKFNILSMFVKFSIFFCIFDKSYGWNSFSNYFRKRLEPNCWISWLLRLKPNNLGCVTNTDWYFLNFKNSVLTSNEFDNMIIISRIFQEAKFSYLVYILKLHKTKGTMLQTLIFLIRNLFNSLRCWG